MAARFADPSVCATQSRAGVKPNARAQSTLRGNIFVLFESVRFAVDRVGHTERHFGVKTLGDWPSATPTGAASVEQKVVRIPDAK
jgi:hypothetical protein